MFISANHSTCFSTLTLSICGLDIGVHYTSSTPMPTETPVPTTTSTLTSVPISTSTLITTATETPFNSKIPTRIPTSTFAPSPLERPDGDNISGRYRMGFEKGSYAGCLLNIVLESNSQTFDEIGFELYCNRGAPSYSSGYGAGKILIFDNIAVYTPQWGLFPEVECNIVFQFKENAIKVTQLGSDFDCGFGHGVYANGYYELVDDQTLILGCLHPVQMNEQCMTPTTSQ